MKQRQILSGSKNSNRFERILLSIGHEPSWLRSNIGTTLPSAPCLTAVEKEEIPVHHEKQSSSPVNDSIGAFSHDEEQKYLSPTSSEYTDRSSVHLLVENSSNYLTNHQ